MKRIVIILFVLLISINAVAKTDLQEIRNAIQERGANWHAAENPIWNLSSAEQRAMLLHEDEKILDSERITPPRRFSGERLSVLDWRNFNGENYVTPVRNQGSCGSCTVFACLASMESRIAIMDSTPDPTIDLSEQYVLSCGPASCSGALSGSVCGFLMDTGVVPEACVPYEANDDPLPDEICQAFQMKARKLSSWSSLDSSTDAIKNALESGPVAARFKIYEDFLAYNSGVYEHVWGEYLGIHMVSIVGYVDSLACWICKNSWGEGWAEDGFFKIKWENSDINNRCLQLFPAEMDTFISPYLTLSSYSIHDTIFGNGDGKLFHGEVANLDLEIMNLHCFDLATNITGTLWSDDERIVIQHSESTFPDLDSGEFGFNQDSLIVFLASADNFDTPIQLYLTLEANSPDYTYADTLSFTIEIATPELSFVYYDVEDTLEGNGDNALNPNEKASLRVKIKNDENGIFAETISATLTTADDRVIIVNGQSTYPDLAAGDAALNEPAFDLSITDKFGQDLIYFSLNVQSVKDGFIYEKTFLFYVDYSASQAGWPQYFTHNNINEDILLHDLNNDGKQEMIYTGESGTDSKFLEIRGASGELLDGFPKEISPKYSDLFSVGDVNNDGTSEILIVGNNNRIVIYRITGSIMLQIECRHTVITNPVLSDLDNDDDLEIIFGDDMGLLYAYHHTGEPFSEDIPFNFYILEWADGRLGVADLDDDGQKDILFINDRLYAASLDGELLDGWHFGHADSLIWGPSVIEFDGENKKIVVCSPNQLFVFNPDGTLDWLKGNLSLNMPPTFADLDSDGNVEMLYFYEGSLHILNGDGTYSHLADEKPIDARHMVTHPLFYDIDEDGMLEFIFSSAEGKLYVMNPDGSIVPPYPLGEMFAFYTFPAIGDIDADGDAELFCVNQLKINAFDLNVTTTDSNPWYTYRGNSYRTGYYNEFRGIEEPPAPPPAEPPEKYTLSQNYPNPFNPETTIHFTLPKKSKIDLKIYDITGKLVRNLMDDTKDAGDYSVKWNGNDEENQPLPSGVYIYRITAGEFEKTRTCILLR